MATQIVMDRTGDTRHTFDANNLAAVAKAERRFMELTGAGFTAATRMAPANSAANGGSSVHIVVVFGSHDDSSHRLGDHHEQPAGSEAVPRVEAEEPLPGVPDVPVNNEVDPDERDAERVEHVEQSVHVSRVVPDARRITL
jgi:hypothetical protein